MWLLYVNDKLVAVLKHGSDLDLLEDWYAQGGEECRFEEVNNINRLIDEVHDALREL